MKKGKFLIPFILWKGEWCDCSIISRGIKKRLSFILKENSSVPEKGYTFHVPAKENYQTLEEAEIIHLNRDVTEILLQKIPKLEIIARIATEDELITCQKIIASFVCLSPEERYNELMENNGKLFNRVPQNYIASYLGVSAETLSRIKKRVMMRG